MSVESFNYITSSSSEESSATKAKRKKPLWQENVSEDWLAIVKQSRNCSLTLNGIGFCKSWTLADSIRDLIQNATDSMYSIHKKRHKCLKPRVVIDELPSSWDRETKIITTIYLECEKGGRQDAVGYLLWTPKYKNTNGPIISIINLNGSFNSDALCLGVSTKSERDAGGHGEGLKSAVTVAMRTKNAFEIFQSGVALLFNEKRGIVGYRALNPAHKELQFKSLTKELTKTLGITPQKDVLVHLGNNPELKFDDYREAVQRFLFFTHRHAATVNPGPFPVVARKETRSGRAVLLGEEFAGKVYVMGIYFKRHSSSQQAYGVDFIKGDALNRDRNEISQIKYLEAMAILISELLDEDPPFAEVILREFLNNEKAPQVGHLEELPDHISNKAKKNIVQAFKNRPENSDIQFIVAGTSTDHLEDNAVVPKLCDVRACKVVHPILFSLIREDYPSIDEIKERTRVKLAACPELIDETRKLSKWLEERLEFFKDGSNRLPGQVEVRQSGSMHDVPYYIIENGKIIFSQRALAIKESDPRKFLDIVNSALQEPQKPVTTPPHEALRQQDAAIREPYDELLEVDEKEYVNEEYFSIPPPPSKPLNFTSDFTLRDEVPESDFDDNEKISELIKSLTKTISFGKYKILSTHEGYDEWISRESPSVSLLTTRAIVACSQALSTFADSSILSFYISLDSSILGYASEDAGININLRSVLLEEHVEESELKAYFDVLIAHEYAHYTNSKDGHKPTHGQRTEKNLQLILQRLYKTSSRK